MLDDSARLKMMTEKLYLEVFHGRIDNGWEENFIRTCWVNIRLGKSLTEKQVTKLEELFERY